MLHAVLRVLQKFPLFECSDKAVLSEPGCTEGSSVTVGPFKNVLSWIYNSTRQIRLNKPLYNAFCAEDKNINTVSSAIWSKKYLCENIPNRHYHGFHSTANALSEKYKLCVLHIPGFFFVPIICWLIGLRRSTNGSLYSFLTVCTSFTF